MDQTTPLGQTGARSQAKRAPASAALLTPDEVCEILKVTRHWLYAQVQRQRIPHVRMGRRLRFKPGDIERYIDHQYSAGPTKSPPRKSRN